MERDPEPGGRIRLDSVFDDEMTASITYNLGKMFAEALECPGGIRGLDGAKGRDALPLLEQAISRMEADPAHYRALNPPNGWGDLEGAVKLLGTLKKWCASHPDAYLVVR